MWVRTLLATLVFAGPAAAQFELDLSATADVKPVLIVPPLMKGVKTAAGFTGLDTRKVPEHFDKDAHKRFAAAFNRHLDGKAISTERTMAAIAAEGVSTTLARTAVGITRLARATGAASVVLIDLTKPGTVTATLYDAAGDAKGEPLIVSASGLTPKAIDELAGRIAKDVIAFSKSQAAPPPPAPVAQIDETFEPPSVETEAIEKKGPSLWSPDPRAVPHVAVVVGPGATLRSLNVSGAAAANLAALQNGAVVAFDVAGSVAPLQFFAATANHRWSDLEIELHYRHAFVRATSTDGSGASQDCTMNDDDLQARGTWRYQLGDGYLPSVGAAVGWSQERTRFACALPLVSTTWRGVDAQLRVHQPLYRDRLALEFSAGPRFIGPGSGIARGLGVAGELWVEYKPASVFFARAGGRIARLTGSREGLFVGDTRTFLSIEVGAFF